MKSKITITITLLISISFLVLTPGIALCYEDDEYVEEVLFMDDFEDPFPSDGWILLSENEENTWLQITEVEFDYPGYDEKIIQQASSGDYFVFVGGNEGHYNEILISPIVSIEEPPDEADSWDQEIFFGYFLTTDNPDFNLSISICYDCDKIENAKWKIVADLDEIIANGEIRNNSFWRHVYIPIYAEVDRPFRISLSFEGNTSAGFGIDYYTAHYYSLHYDNDDGETLNAGPGPVNSGCTCSISDDTRPDLILGMLLIGAFFAFLRLRKKS